jgi:tetratricopeptide (TPR) repeat protein
VTVPRWIRRVLIRGLQPDPENRFADMHELLLALRSDPGRRWRTWAAVSVSGAVLSVGVLAYLADDGGGTLYCDNLSAHLDGVWDKARRTELEARFAASAQPYAAQAWAATERYIDDYADRWRELQGEACRAQIEGTLPNTVLALRMSCLDRHRDHLGVLVELFASADAGVIEGAVDAAAGLPDPAACVDVERVSASLDGLDTDAERRARAELETGISRAQVQLGAARYEQAEATAAEVAARARQRDDAWMLAEAALVRADAEEALGHTDLAEDLYHDALSAALRAGHSRAVAEVSIGLLWIAGRSTRPLADVRRWLGHGEAALARIGGHPEYRARLLNAAGRGFLNHGKFKDAETLLRMAVRIREDTFGKGHPSLAEPLENLGRLLATQGKYGEAEAVFEQTLELAELQYGPNHPAVASAADNLGAALGRQHLYERGLVLHRRALLIKERSLGEEHPRTGLSHQNVAFSLVGLGRAREALPHADATLAAARQADGERSARAAVAHALLREVHASLGHADEALAHARLAVEIGAEALGPSHPDLAQYQLDLAAALGDAGAFHEAVPWAETATRARRDLLGEDHPQLGAALVLLADVQLGAQHPANEALGNAARGVEILRGGPSDPLELARGRLTLARALQASGDLGRARTEASAAREVFAAQGERHVRAAERAASFLESLPPT